MNRLEPGRLRVVLYEGAGGRCWAEDGAECTARLLEAGYPVTFRGGAVGGDTVGEEAGPGEEVLILGRSDDAGGLGSITGQAGRGRAHRRDIDGLDPDAVVDLADAVRREEALAPPVGRKPWFPVIDYDRCTHCMQCLSFCLFDVYGVNGDGEIEVRNATHCKTDCPACSRVCPEVAILFPKYRHGPINGAEIAADDLRREAMKVDISSLLGGDIYATLRDRSARAKSRFARERDEDRALKERRRCLARLQEELDVPAEVLAALPSPAEIQARAQRARAEGGAGGVPEVSAGESSPSESPTRRGGGG